MDPNTPWLAIAHSEMRSAQPRHRAGAVPRHQAAGSHPLAAAPRGASLAPGGRTRTPPAEGETLLAPVPATVPVARTGHTTPAHHHHPAAMGAGEPRTSGGRTAPNAKRAAEIHEHLPPTHHRQAIRHPATAAELRERALEQGLS